MYVVTLLLCVLKADLYVIGLTSLKDNVGIRCRVSEKVNWARSIRGCYIFVKFECVRNVGLARPWSQPWPFIPEEVREMLSAYRSLLLHNLTCFWSILNTGEYLGLKSGSPAD